MLDFAEYYDELFDLDDIDQAFLSGQVELDCGCIVELDGECPCGNYSPLLALGMV